MPSITILVTLFIPFLIVTSATEAPSYAYYLRITLKTTTTETTMSGTAPDTSTRQPPETADEVTRVCERGEPRAGELQARTEELSKHAEAFLKERQAERYKSSWLGRLEAWWTGKQRGEGFQKETGRQSVDNRPSKTQ